MSPADSRAVTQLAAAALSVRDRLAAAGEPGLDDISVRRWAADAVRALAAADVRVRNHAADTCYRWCWTPPAATEPVEPPAGWWATDLGRQVARALPATPDDRTVISVRTAAAMLGVSPNRVGQLVDDQDQPVRRAARGMVYRSGVVAYLLRPVHRNDRYRRP